MKKYFLMVNAPEEYCDKVRQAMGEAGAGQLGNYAFGSFSYRGTDRFLPLKGARPAIGEVGKLEVVSEEKIEVFCTEDKLQAVLEAIHEAHPYEEPCISYFPVEIS